MIVRNVDLAERRVRRQCKAMELQHGMETQSPLDTPCKRDKSIPSGIRKNLRISGIVCPKLICQVTRVDATVSQQITD